VYLGRIAGAVVATRKDGRLHARRLLRVRPVGLDGAPLDRPEDVALDPGLDAGEGDVVLVAKEGAVVADLFDADRAEGEPATPANVVVVAIVDDWTPRG
jgi:microcompartment protein CcmK/EutM